MYNMFFGRRKTFQVNNAETTYKVHYLGNVMTSLIKGVGNRLVQLNEEIYVSGEFDKENFIKELPDLKEESIDEKSMVKSITSTSIDKPVKILWDNHLKHNGHAGLKMKLTLTQGGLRVITKDHGKIFNKAVYYGVIGVFFLQRREGRILDFCCYVEFGSIWEVIGVQIIV